jgi:motility quorum-sensing regulator/GCU-specific mRNA interferase toxin
VEKRLPQYALDAIKATFCDVPSLRLTSTARRSARDLDFTLVDVVAVIQSTTREYFYKSMTTYASSVVWQDVYHVPYRGVVLYVKFTLDPDGHLVISFKEK